MKFFEDIKGFFKGTRSEVIEFWRKEKVVDIKDLIIGIFSYGLFINFMLWGITTTIPILPVIYFTWKFPAYGVLYYFIFKELPRLCMQLKARPR